MMREQKKRCIGFPKNKMKWKVNKLLGEAQFHGAKRLAEGKDRFLWAMSLVLFLWMALSVLSMAVARYFESPTYLAVFETGRKFVPFPVVLVCPEVSFQEHKMDAFIEDIKLPSALNASFLKSVLRQLAAFYSPDVDYSTKTLDILQGVLDYNQIDVEEATTRLTETCEDTVLRCRFQGKFVNCSNIFKMHLTNFGYCCTFNGRSLRSELKSFGLYQLRKPAKPLVVGAVGPIGGLEIVVNNSQPKDDLDLSYKWLVMQSGKEFVDYTSNGTPISAASEVWAGIVRNELMIDKDASALSAQLRRCRMSYEPLKYFPVYNKRYCLIECEMARTLQRCQCVRFSHPRPPGASYCRPESLLCAKNAAVPYGTDECNCPSTCDTSMEETVTQTYELTSEVNPVDYLYQDFNVSDVTVLRAFVMFRDTKLQVRRPFYEAFNLFSQLGGVFSVFFGCSVLSLLEVGQLLWQVFRCAWTSSPKVHYSRTEYFQHFQRRLQRKVKKITTMNKVKKLRVKIK